MENYVKKLLLSCCWEKQKLIDGIPFSYTVIFWSGICLMLQTFIINHVRLEVAC